MQPDPSRMNAEQFNSWVTDEIEKARPAYEAAKAIAAIPAIYRSVRWNVCEDAKDVIESYQDLKAEHANLPAIDKVMQGVEEIKIEGKWAAICLFLDNFFRMNEHWMSVVFVDGKKSYLLKVIIDGRARFGSGIYQDTKKWLIDLAKDKIASLETDDATQAH